ncbi:pullulanase [Ktedonobacteria bacterium brp13]|nr:pullulanase [Ktedonobacteria bacterium brp13]
MQIPVTILNIYSKNSYLENVYLEDATTLLVTLAQPLTLPCRNDKLLLSDRTSGEVIPVASVDTANRYQAVVVSNFQHLLGSEGDWNTTDPLTQLKKVHSNLYQCTLTLPKGIYSYKFAFNGGWQWTLPASNVELNVPADQTKVTFSLVPCDLTTQQTEVYDSINQPAAEIPASSAGMQADQLLVTLSQAPNVTHTLELSLQGYRNTLQVIARHVLDTAAYTYSGNDLGVTLTAESTSFRLWAPTATEVQVLLFEHENGPVTLEEHLHADQQGTWYLLLPRSLENWSYLYLVTVQGQTQTALDPYARACTPNALRGLIVDLAKTNPAGWDEDQHLSLQAAVDAIIYELHVRDFSISEDSGMVHKGEYLAFTEDGTQGPSGVSTGLEHLKELGITHVQIMPPARFASVDETRVNEYNWGYDPCNYNIPQGSYASNPGGSARINEFKQLVQSLHHAGLGVTIDVVYNHTFTIHSTDFDKIVPQYYYRTDDRGNYTNGSGCGNELATERPMVRKFVRDSVNYWISEYHIDGLRFDLMALIGTETMVAISEDLRAIHPDILLYGEPWCGGESGLPSSQLLTKGQQRGLQIGVFNDEIRGAIIGSVFAKEEQGFATGAQGLAAAIKQSVIGSTKTFANEPGEVVNYTSSHDNFTLWDKIAQSNAQNSEDQRIRMDELAQAIVLTSQGIPFIQGGEDFLRTKGGNDNSYNAGDSVNQLTWARKATYHAVFQYYANLIHLRRQHPAFRLRNAHEIDQQLTFLDSPQNTVAFQIDGKASGDSWSSILVIYNPNTHTCPFTLPAGNWTVVGKQGEIAEQGLQEVEGTLTLEEISCTILHI